MDEESFHNDSILRRDESIFTISGVHPAVDLVDRYFFIILQGGYQIIKDVFTSRGHLDVQDALLRVQGAHNRNTVVGLDGIADVAYRPTRNTVQATGGFNRHGYRPGCPPPHISLVLRISK